MLSLVDLVRILTSPDRLIQLLSPMFTSWLGYALLFAIVFSETGLLVGFFLPGDSLMFLIGAVAGPGPEPVRRESGLMAAAFSAISPAALVDAGSAIDRPDSRWFRREYLPTHATRKVRGRSSTPTFPLSGQRPVAGVGK
jgi:membrane-associated protein